MEINWSIISAYVAPLIALFIGAAIDHLIERKPRLIAYFTHATAFDLADVNPPTTIHTHGIIIRNVGKKPAIDVRVRHHILPSNFKVFPVIEHNRIDLPGGGVEIVFPVLVPNEQVSISYLYPSTLFYNQIHAGIRHSEGFATEVTALPTPQYSAWIRWILWSLLILGVIALIYLIIEGSLFAYKVFNCLKINC